MTLGKERKNLSIEINTSGRDHTTVQFLLDTEPGGLGIIR